MEMTKKNETRRYDFSLMRAVSCLAVVILHTFHTANAMHLVPENQTSFALAVKAVMVFAVPCFVMVTGALLLSPERSFTLKKLFGRYISRTVIVLIVFTVFFALSDYFFSGTGSAAASLASVPGKLWTDGSWSHMWYLYTLIGLYLLMPAFRKVAAYSDGSEMRYLLLIGTVFLTVLPVIDIITGMKTGFRIAVTSVYPLFLFAGYASDRGILKIRKSAAAVLLLVSTAAIAMIAVWQTADVSGILKELLSGYDTPLVLFQSLSVFVLLAGIKPGKVSRLVCSADSCSFGIYLIHLFWLRLILVRLGKAGMTDFSIPAIFLISAAVYVVSYISVRILKMIPGVKRIL